MTDANGEYSFVRLTSGNYNVAEVLQTDWVQTFPSGTHVITVTSGETVRGLNFGNQKADSAEIHGTKWLDENGNGKRDNNEPGLEGWTIFVDLNGNGELDSNEPFTITDTNGDYSLSGLDSGTYAIAEVLQDGWRQTYPGSVQYFELEDLPLDKIYKQDESFTTTGTLGDGVTGQVTKFTGLDGTSTTSGLAAVVDNGYAGGGGQELFLANANVELDFGVPIAGLTFQFSDQGGTVNLMVNGDQRVVQDFLELDGLTVGGALVTVNTLGRTFGRVTIEGTITSFAVGGQELAVDLLCVFQPGMHIVTVGSGQTSGGLNFGNQSDWGDIHGTKWDDANGNGEWDKDESGLEGWTIYVDLNGNGELDSGEPSTTTDVNGDYSLTGLDSGTYTIAEVLQDGWQQTFPGEPHYFDFSDLEIRDSYKYGEQFSTVSTESDTAQVEVTSLLNADGTYSSGGMITVGNNGYAGGNGQELYIYNANLEFSFSTSIDGLTFQFKDLGGIVNLMVNEDQRAVEDFSDLDGLTVGGVLVTVTDLGNAVGRVSLAGTIQSFAVGGQGLAIDLLCIPQPGVHVVRVDSGQTIHGLDFGNRNDSGEIHGTKWYDMNGDGRRGPDEPGLSGWVIYVDLNGNGELDAGEPSTVTDSNGDYVLTDLPSGMYTVAEVMQSGWQQTYPLGRQYFELEDLPQGNSYKFGKIFSTTSTYGDVATAKVTELVNLDGTSVSEGAVQVVTTGLAGSSGQELSISKANLEFDFGDTIHELTFQFYESTDNVVNLSVNGDRRVAGNLSDLNGLTIGGTSVTVTMYDKFGMLIIAGNVDAFAVGGQDLTIDWICIPQSGVHVVTVDLGQTVRGLHFGNQRDSGDVTGIKYEDLNGNGVRDPGEPGMPGVQIYVDQNNDGVLNVDQSGNPTEPVTVTIADNALTRVDESGMYLLFGLPAGQHVVREVVPEGYFQTEPVAWSTRLQREVANGVGHGMVAGQTDLLLGTIDANFDWPVFERPNAEGERESAIASGYVVDIQIGQTVSDRNFGNFHGGEVHGREV